MTSLHFDQIDLVLCEDGETVVAYAYPNADDDEGLVVITLPLGTVPLEAVR